MILRCPEISEPGLEFYDNLRGHFERFLPIYRVFPPSPVGLEFPRTEYPICQGRETTQQVTHTKLNLYNLSLTCRRYARMPAESNGSRCKSISISTSL